MSTTLCIRTPPIPQKLLWGIYLIQATKRGKFIISDASVFFFKSKQPSLLYWITLRTLCSHMVNTWLLFLTALNINKDYTQPILWNHLLLFVICKNICGDTRDLTDNPGSLRVKYNLQMVKMVIFVEYKLHYALKLWEIQQVLFLSTGNIRITPIIFLLLPVH